MGGGGWGHCGLHVVQRQRSAPLKWTCGGWKFILNDEINDPGKMDGTARMLGAHWNASVQLRKLEDQTITALVGATLLLIVE